MATTYNGFNGLMVMGGILDGSPRLNGALASSITTMALDDNGTGSLKGVILGGDTFTISGETGSPTHTVTAGVAFTIAGASCTSITFTPAIATGGVSDNATLTFTSNSIAQIKSWSLTVEQTVHDNTAFGEKWAGKIGGISRFAGHCEGYLDLADTKQASLASALASATPSTAVVGLCFRTYTSQQFYGFAIPTRAKLSHPHDGLVEVGFDFMGDSSVLRNWG